MLIRVEEYLFRKLIQKAQVLRLGSASNKTTTLNSEQSRSELGATVNVLKWSRSENGLRAPSNLAELKNVCRDEYQNIPKSAKLEAS